MFRNLILSFIITAAASMAAVNCNNPNTSLGVLGQAAVLNGCLTDTSATVGAAGDGLIVFPTNGDFSGQFGASVAWSITNSAGVYTYQYTFRDGDDTRVSSDQEDIRYAIIGLSASCTTATTSSTQGNNCIWDLKAPDNSNFDQTPSIGTWTSQPGPTSIYGLYAEADNKAEQYTITFKSQRVPVWQNVYFRGDTNSELYAYNAGYGHTGSGFYIAAPDTATVTPEPAHFGMLGAAVSAVMLLVRRKRAANS